MCSSYRDLSAHLGGVAGLVLTKTLNDTMFPFPMISSGAQLGVIGDLCSFWGSLLYFGSIVGP